jgi:hypothetical protein
MIMDESKIPKEEVESSNLDSQGDLMIGLLDSVEFNLFCNGPDL